MMSAIEKLMRNTVKSGKCIVWTGPKDLNGYALYAFDGRGTLRVHRYVYEMVKGPIPEGYYVCHECDNPSCVKPSHLFAGTPRDNTQDMLKKGRRKKSKRGAEHHNSKLCLKERNEIRQMVARGDKQAAVARHFGVTQSLVSQIWRRVDNYSPEKERLLAEAEARILLAASQPDD